MLFPAFEHLIIFVDDAKSKQVWQWVARQPGTPAAYREHHYYPASQSGDLLIQKLSAITIPFSEEEAIDLTGTVFKLRDAFDRDTLTKTFYKQFEREHAAFLAFIKGIKEQGDAAWYASLMLNRLMFVYFIQKQRFLDNNDRYLRDRLEKVQALKGKQKFQTFYNFFLMNLFQEGFGKQEGERKLSPDLVALLGKVPYLNGGLFDVHELELTYKGIVIPDAAFERLFSFFDEWDWHLDTGPLATGKEINPDVLGYIFEKYINQKQMGAYYTKEDITDYISKNTIIPYLFDAVLKSKQDCAADFAPDSTLWRQLKDNPDSYLYEAVRFGVIDQENQIIPLPDDIAKGIHDVSQRAGWNKPAPAPFALATETWREYVARRQRCLELRQKLAAGEVHQINDLLTLNLDIKQFAADAIASCDRPEFLRAFYQAISTVTVLDPTCGSGAFLFASLNILEPLYEACLDRMTAFVEDFDRADTPARPAKGNAPKKYSDFRKILDDVAKHSSRTYFVFKSIIVHNLYGVDIMEEAVEICKLRLFLKLVAQVQPDPRKPNLGLEPLPDIDFNIRAGNTLVGYATLNAVKSSLKGTFGFEKDEVKRIEEEAEVVDLAFRKFHQMQTHFGMNAAAFAESKQDLRQRLDKLASELDAHLAGDYGVAADKPKLFAAWQKSHEPFHWFAEFYGIMSKGGFNVIVGNPPYVEIPQTLSRGALRNMYRTALERWSRDEDLYTLVVERSFQISNCKLGRFGMILPLSFAFSTKRPFQELRRVVSGMQGAWWWSHFDRIPSALFGNDVRTRCTIAIFAPTNRTSVCRATTSLIRWTAECRDTLFPLLAFARLSASLNLVPGILKVATQIQADALESLLKANKTLESDLRDGVPFSTLAASAPHFPQPCVFVGGTAYNWFPVWRDVPETTDRDGHPSLPARTAAFKFRDEETANLVLALLGSAMGYWWWAVASDGFNLKKWLLDRFPLSLDRIPSAGRKELSRLGAELREELRQHYVYKDNKGRIGNFFLPACAELTSQIDSAITKHIPQLSDAFFEDVRRFNLSFSRAIVEDDLVSTDND